jgi:hypothetical protein
VNAPATSPVAFSKDFQVEGLPREAAFLIPVPEWDHIRYRIQRLGPAALFFHTVASIAAGVAGSAFVAALSPCPAAKDATISSATMWVLTGSFTLLSVLSYVFAHKQRSMAQVATTDVVDEMDRVRTRYDATKGA